MRERRFAYKTPTESATSWPNLNRLSRDVLLSARVHSTLLVDRQRTSTRLISDLLQRLGFADVQVVHDAEDALAMLREKKYGLVLAEWNLSPMSGLQLLRAVRRDDKLRRIPVLITAAHLTCEDVVLARHTGADALLLKPFLATALRSKIDEVTVTRKLPRAGIIRSPETI